MDYGRKISMGLGRSLAEGHRIRATAYGALVGLRLGSFDVKAGRDVKPGIASAIRLAKAASGVERWKVLRRK